MDGLQVGSAGDGRYTLPKCERLAKRNEIGRLFTNGEAFLVYPVKCTYLFRSDGESEAGNRIMVMAPKRNHKRAVARNLLKRRMREAYRLNKYLLEKGSGHEPMVADIAFSYIAKGEPLDYGTIEKAVISILNKLCTIRNDKALQAGGPPAEK